MAQLEVQALSFSYPGALAPTLENIDFGVSSGGSLALLGSSGAGKTTLLNLLSGLLPCSSGRILFDGADVASKSARDRGVAQVFQFPVMYESLTVRDNIAFPLRNSGAKKRDRNLRADEVAELFDLHEVLGLKPRELSLFQKQLVGFAKALVRNDLPMVLLDEPLTAVEPAMKWRLRRAVKRAQAELETTMVYVTHDQTEALTFADEVSVLHGGKLLQTGTPQALYEAPAHAEVARFIGNPGMNLLGVEHTEYALQDHDLPSNSEVLIGFRPEWANLRGAAESSSLPGADAEEALLRIPAIVESTRLTGSDAGVSLGIARVSVGPATVQVTCRMNVQLRQPIVLELHRYEIFCDGRRWTEPVSLGAANLKLQTGE